MFFFKKKKSKDKNTDNAITKEQVITKNEEGQVINLEDKERTIFERNKKTLKDLIAPEHIDFTKSERYVTLGDKYYVKNLYVGILPNQVNFASFLHNLYNFGNIDTSIHIHPVDTEEAKAELSKLRTNLEMELLSATGSNRADDMRAKVLEAQRLREEVRDGYNKIFEVSIISTLYEEDERSLNNRTDQLKEILGQQDIGLKSATFVQEEAFKSNKPLGKNYLGEWHTFDRRALACIFPFTSNNINHPNGVLIGFNMDNSLPIFYDTFYSGLDNYNMVIFAKSGGGKSTFIKMLSARSSTLDNIQNIFIDIEPEYRDICDTLGGINITISPYSNEIINPFDIVPDIVENEVTGREEEKVLLSQRINSVTSLLMTMAKGTTGISEFYNDILKMIIKECVMAEYDRLEITEDPHSLYRYEEERIDLDSGKIIGGKVKKEMPTISSWYRQLVEKAKNNTNSTYAPYYDYLLKVMKDYSREQNGSFVCFDGQSTVEINYDIPFINFDVSQLNENSELPLAQHLITDYIWEHLVKRNTKGHKIRVGIDEAWRMINYPEALDFLITMFRRARKKNTSTVVISQQFDEFYKEETKPIIKNADTKLFLPPDPSSVDDIQEVFKLTEGETLFLRNCKRGEGLLIVNNISAKLDINIPDFELEFVETNQNEKLRRMGEKEKKRQVYIQ